MSTYLLRKQAAAAEGRNHREEAEKSDRRIERQTGQKENERQVGRRQEREGDFISDRDHKPRHAKEQNQITAAVKQVSERLLVLWQRSNATTKRADNSSGGKGPANLRERTAGSS